MSFRDPEGAANAWNRLEEATGSRVPGYFADAFAGNPDPDLALTNLERWLSATGNPGLYMGQIAGVPALGKLLIMILGASQPLADSLIQNPELSSLILEPGQISAVPSRDRILAEGRRLLVGAMSFSHSLDRLRFLRQRWTLPIVINDLSGAWEQEDVWRALSDLADALIELALEAVWTEHRPKFEGKADSSPILVAAFGKLGGHELNYSSDVDLVYASEDDQEESVARASGRLAEALGRALSDRMGRGSLYRVDLRLRPYGNSGPILPSMRAVEAYYRLYAEAWEVQALLRSRVVSGPPELAARWEAMRLQTCFRPKWSEMAVEEMVAMRARTEASATSDDLKRGAGGIRDVEFLVQVLQLLHGHDHPELQIRPTCAAIRALDAAGFVEHPVAAALVEAYTFLRKMEHRAQLVGDRQTHAIPASAEAREQLARSMAFETWSRAAAVLDAHRRTIQTLYRSSLSPATEGSPTLQNSPASARGFVARELEGQAPAALQWIDVLPESEGFYETLATEPESLERARGLLLRAPRLVAALKGSVALTEMLLSGEFETVADPVERIHLLPGDVSLAQLADVYRSVSTTILVQWSLGGSPFDLGERLARLMEAVLAHCLHRLYADMDVVATGSFGAREMGPGSDLDLILLVADKDRQAASELQAQQLLELVGRLRRFGAPIDIDLRLRPEGGKGLLVRTYDGFRTYDFEGMEMWERFALGNARQLSGDPAAFDVVRHSAYGLPLSPERLRELMRMKRRVETERVKPQHVHRDVKLGSGGLNDIEWFVHLHEMRYPEATGAAKGDVPPVDERIRRLARVGLINMVEAEMLLAARRYLLDLRARIYLQGLSDDLMPENPDRLDRLADGFGLAGANELLAKHRTVTESVRRLFTEGVDRLRP